ncbi:hypothetical protein HNQ59_003562 [Chitinivorax tropicus]|uniref:Uncharacterized protein n=1 Tax=Chitinivorax tropicus TaxID=714531 RepID=A0A840MS51_9PROT|nr:hypothetical protein [Chitinivorax tropicus]MBB5020245.1 hypothetical protein [Chitinivorax tropicus]
MRNSKHGAGGETARFNNPQVGIGANGYKHRYGLVVPNIACNWPNPASGMHKKAYLPSFCHKLKHYGWRQRYFDQGRLELHILALLVRLIHSPEKK